MPVKRRIDKRRPTIAPGLWAWAFETGFDMGGYLRPFGVIDPARLKMEEREAAQAAWDSALRDAWARHGAAHMAEGREPYLADELPWAAEVFGMPEGMEGDECR